MVQNQGKKQREQRILGDCWQWEFNGQCSGGDNCSFRHDINKRAKLTQSKTSPREMRREPEVPVVECIDGLARMTSKELATTHFVKGGTFQNACSTRPRVVAGLERSARMHIVRLMNSRLKVPKRMMTREAVALLKKGDWHESIREPGINYVTGHDRSGRLGKKRVKELERGSTGRGSSNARQLGCVFQDMKPPKSILRKGTDMQRPIQRVKITKATARHTKIRSQEETEWQEQGAREAAWKLAKRVFKLKEHERATFFSPSENGCLPAQILNLRNGNLLSTPERRCI